MKTKKKKNKHFVKKNLCPYCTYPCDSAGALGGPDGWKARSGDISFCLMCCQASVWDANMKLVKFDLNSIPNLLERNRIKLLGMKVEEFWDKNPDIEPERRRKYLKIMEKRNEVS